MHKGARNIQNIIPTIFLSLTAILALALCIVLLLRNASLKRSYEAYKSELETIRSEGYVTETDAMSREEAAGEKGEKAGREAILQKLRKELERGDNTVLAIRSLFPDQLMIAHEGKYRFYEILDSIPRHGFAPEDFETDEDGIMQYVGSDTSREFAHGIDVSRFQGEIDWEKVADDGVDFAIIRVGARGTTKGAIVADPTFVDNIEGAQKAGIDCGVYFYSQALNAEEAQEEADFVLEQIAPYTLKYPVVLDVEIADLENARTEHAQQDQYHEVLKTFSDAIRGAGYDSMVYGNIKTFTLLLDPARMEQVPVWIAYYSLPQYYPYEFSIWQYSSSGNVDGIDGDVDLNIAVK